MYIGEKIKDGLRMYYLFLIIYVRYGVEIKDMSKRY